jgi:hypothetical protein
MHPLGHNKQRYDHANTYKFFGFEVLPAVNMKGKLFRAVAPYSLVEVY